MKKIYSLIILIIIVIIGFIIYLNIGREESDSFYAIKEAKGYILKDDSKLHIDIYSKLDKSIITYVDDNSYQIKNNELIYNLENVEIKTSKIGDLYVNRIDADLIKSSNDLLIIDDAILSIKNKSFTLNINIGYISILNPKDYSLLSFNNYYGSYAYINGALELVGINLELTNKYNKLSNFNIGDFAKGNLKNIKYNLYENEIDIKTIIPKYNLYNNDNLEISLEKNVLFIPISYIKLLMIKETYITLSLDDTLFYIDHFSFISNALDYHDYKDLLEEGNIIYA